MASEYGIQFKRSNIATTIPSPEALLEGEISINLQDKKLFTKDADGNIINIGFDYDMYLGSNNYVKENGGPISGVLTYINGAEDNIATGSNLNLAHKGYVDNSISSALSTIDYGAFIVRTGDTMQGNLDLLGQANTGNSATTFDFVDNTYIRRDGGKTITGNLNLLVTPNSDNHIINRIYADNRYIRSTGGLATGDYTFSNGTVKITGTTDLASTTTKKLTVNGVAQFNGDVNVGSTSSAKNTKLFGSSQIGRVVSDTHIIIGTMNFTNSSIVGVNELKITGGLDVGGNVSIGTTSANTVTVTGSVSVTNNISFSNSSQFNIGSTGLAVKSGSSTSVEFKPYGLRLKNDSSGSAANPGGLRYNPTSGTVQYYDGSRWRNVGTPGSPLGTVYMFPINAPIPAGYEVLDGHAITTASHPKLYAWLVAYSGGKFGGRLPDWRGRFVRGYGGNSGNYFEDQGDAIRNITGSIDTGIHKSGDPTGAFTSVKNRSSESNKYNEGWRMTFDASKVVPTANENRPLNVAVKWFIKATDEFNEL